MGVKSNYVKIRVASNIKNRAYLFCRRIRDPFPLVYDLFHLGRSDKGRGDFTFMAKVPSTTLARFAYAPAVDGHGN